LENGDWKLQPGREIEFPISNFQFSISNGPMECRERYAGGEEDDDEDEENEALA
jgi:hypothetical protein